MALTGMNIEEVEQKLAELKNGASNLDALTLKVGNLQGPLTDAWEGVEASACVEYLNKLSTKMQKMSEELMKIHQWADKTKTNYEDSASKGANAYRA